MSSRSSSYRPDIQGLRAVAALLVAIYHIWLGRVSGGVDVFFVVSGYLILGGLLRQAEQRGGIDALAYATRLFRRLLPAAMTVLLATLIASVLWLPKVRWGEAVYEFLAAALYYENWQLALNSVDYLARDAAPSPVQHFWALSLQGQFYLLSPFVVVLASLAARGRRLRLRTAFVVLLLLAFAASLGYSIHATADNQPFAYFDTRTRLWEFCLGGLVAALPLSGRGPGGLRAALGWLGLLAIPACGIAMQVSSTFPGYAALWPTLAAAVLLAVGGDRHRFGAGRLLGSRPLAWLGDISYSLYLWHWPLLIFYRIHSGEARIGLLPGLGILAVSLLLAVATTRWVENPVRRSPRIGTRRWHGPALAGVCLAPVLAGIVAWAYPIHARRAAIERLMVSDAAYPGAAVMDREWKDGLPESVPAIPAPLDARDDLPSAYAERCHQAPRRPEPLMCRYGSPDPVRTVALVGGSHSAHWLPALQRVAEAEGWAVLSFTKSACRFDGLRRHWDDSCTDWNQAVMERLKELKPDLVFTTATLVSRHQESIPEGYIVQWRALAEAGIEVVAVRDTPRPEFDVPECVELHGDSPECRRPRSALLPSGHPLDGAAALPANVHFVDLTDYFCTAEECLPVIGNVLVFRDAHHITATYARTLAPQVRRALVAALERAPLRPNGAVDPELSAGGNATADDAELP